MRVRQLLNLDDFHRNVPRTDGFKVFVFGDYADRVVALGRAGMGAVGGIVGEFTYLLARRTVALVAVVRVRVVTLGVDSTGKSAFWSADFLLAAARNLLGRARTPALDGCFLVARITRSVVAE